MFSYGQVPYAGLGNEDVLERVVMGYRLPKPEHATDEVYSLMLQCWGPSRPNFETLRETFKAWSESGNLEVFPTIEKKVSIHDLPVVTATKNYATLRTFRHNDDGEASPITVKRSKRRFQQRARSILDQQPIDITASAPKSREIQAFFSTETGRSPFSPVLSPVEDISAKCKRIIVLFYGTNGTRYAARFRARGKFRARK